MEVLAGEKEKFKSSGSPAESYKRKLDAYHSAAFDRVNKAIKLDNLAKSGFSRDSGAKSGLSGLFSHRSSASERDREPQARRSDGSSAGSFSPGSCSSASPGPSSPVAAAPAHVPAEKRCRSPRDSHGEEATSRSPSPVPSDHSSRSCPSPGRVQLIFSFYLL